MYSWFPHGQENGKQTDWKTDWKSLGILPKIPETEEILGSYYYYFLIELYLLNRFLYLLISSNKNTEKNTGKWEKK